MVRIILNDDAISEETYERIIYSVESKYQKIILKTTFIQIIIQININWSKLFDR